MTHPEGQSAGERATAALVTSSDAFVTHVTASAEREERSRADLARLNAEIAELTRRYLATRDQLTEVQASGASLERTVEFLRSDSAGIERLKLENATLVKQVATLSAELIAAQRLAERAEDRERALAQQLAAMTLMVSDLRHTGGTHGKHA